MAKNDSVTADFIRAIRARKGYTQVDFADLLRVNQVTVARWESGERQCGGAFARQIKSIGAELDTQTRIGATAVSAISRSDLEKLDSTIAVDMFRELLFAQARWLGVPITKIHITSVIKKDGGIDASIDEGAIDVRDDILVSGGSYFQIKTGDTTKPWNKAWVASELFGGTKVSQSAEALAPRVLECLKRNGRYVLVTFGSSPTEQQVAEAREHLERAFAKCGFAAARVEIWGQDILLGLFAPYPSLCLQISGRNNFEFQDIASWSSTANLAKDRTLHLGPMQVQFVESIRADLRGSEVRHIRITGEPGLGKSRLVLEALSAEDLAPTVVYVALGETFQTSQLFNQILRSDNAYRMILVVDDCPSLERASIWNAIKLRSDRVRLISIYHVPDDVRGEGLIVRECPPLPDENITEIIAEYIPSKFDAQRWAQFCGGSPRVAHAVGLNLKTNPDDLLKAPDTVPIWDRYVAGFGAAGSASLSQTMIALRFIALFQKFGFEDPLSEEAKYIAELATTADPALTWFRFQEIVTDLKARRILQGSRTLFIVPKALHIHLWIQFWNKHGRDFPIKDVLASMPESLERWFSEMFLYGYSSEQASREVVKLLGPDGPFTDEFVESQFACTFLNILAEANPTATLKCIERTIGRWAQEKLISFTEGRQYIVWALEKIAIWKDSFNGAANMLLKLASAENASNGNNATGTFVGLFDLSHGLLAPTEATPDERFPVLKAALSSQVKGEREVAIRACASALAAERGMKAIGPEHQGLRPAAKLWKPKLWGEVFDAYREAWKITVAAHDTAEGKERTDLARVLIDSAMALVLNPNLSKMVLETLASLAEDKNTPLDAIVSFVVTRIKFSNNDLTPATLRQIKRLDKLITGKSYESRLRRVVLLSSWDEDFDPKLGKRSEDLSRKTEELAKEACANPSIFTPLIHELAGSAGRCLFDFGYKLGKVDKSYQFRDAIIAAQEIWGNKGTVQLSGGYLRAMFVDNPAAWETLILTLIEREVLRPVISMMIWASGITKPVLCRILKLIGEGHLQIGELCNSAYSQELLSLGEAPIIDLINCALAHLPDGLEIAVELTYCFYCKKNAPVRLPKDLTLSLLCVGPFTDRGRNTMSSYHWQNVAQQYLSIYPQAGIPLLAAILGKFTEWGFALDLSFSQANSVLRQIIKDNSKEAWKTVASMLDDVHSRHAHGISTWLHETPHSMNDIKGTISLFPVDEILNWVAGDPDARSHFIARILPQHIGNDERGRLTREFMIRFGKGEDVGSALMGNFWSGGFSGPSSVHYREKRDAARGWLAHETSQVVSDWLERYINWLGKEIERAEIEEERRF